jgi:hypothetical protein
MIAHHVQIISSGLAGGENRCRLAVHVLTKQCRKGPPQKNQGGQILAKQFRERLLLKIKTLQCYQILGKQINSPPQKSNLDKYMKIEQDI